MNFKGVAVVVKKLVFCLAGKRSRQAELRPLRPRNLSLTRFFSGSTITLGRIVFLWFVLVSSASAYIDPGSGMLFWQGFIAVIGAVLVFFRNPLAVIRDWIKRLRRK